MYVSIHSLVFLNFLNFVDIEVPMEYITSTHNRCVCMLICICVCVCVCVFEKEREMREILIVCMLYFCSTAQSNPVV